MRAAGGAVRPNERRRRGIEAARPVALLALLALLGAVTPAPALGQTAAREMGAGATFERYGFSDPELTGVESLVLFTTPFGAGAWVGPRLRLEARGAFANGTLTLADGSEASLSGLTDTELRAAFALVPDALGLEVVGYLPSGTSTFDEGEAQVAGLVAADLLPLAIAQWGTGGAVAVGLTGTRRFGEVGVGVTASYRASGAFDPIDGTDFRYQPGSELRLRAALDLDVGRSKLSFAGGMRSFSEDLGDEQNLFQTGDRMELMSTLSFPAGLRGAGAVYGALVDREAGTFLDRADVGTPAENLVLLGGVLRLPIGRHRVLPRLDARVFSRDEGGGAGWIAGGGASMEVLLENATLVPNLGVRLGSIETEDGSSSGTTGFLLGLTIRFSGGGAR